MNIFQRVKGAVSVPEAARYYGMQVHRSNMACCPFHNDKTPSLKLNESYYYCFGCQTSGDVVNLTAELLGVRNYDAAKALVTDFGITGDGSQPRISIQRNSLSTWAEDIFLLKARPIKPPKMPPTAMTTSTQMLNSGTFPCTSVERKEVIWLNKMMYSEFSAAVLVSMEKK